LLLVPTMRPTPSCWLGLRNTRFRFLFPSTPSENQYWVVTLFETFWLPCLFSLHILLLPWGGWLVWHCDNSVGVKLRWARFNTIRDLWRVYHPGSWYLSRPLKPTQSIHPSMRRCNEYLRWFWRLLGMKWWVLHSSGPSYLGCWNTGFSYAS